jgi:hypothetical protein
VSDNTYPTRTPFGPGGLHRAETPENPPSGPAIAAPAAPTRVPARTRKVPTTKPASAAKKGPDRAAIRRIAAKFEEINNASPVHVELLSAALGVENNVVELAVAVMAGGTNSLAGLTDTLALAEETNPYEAIIAAVALGRARLKNVWAVLAEMGAVTGAIPASDVKAGGRIAAAAAELDPTNITEIAAVLQLAKK